MATQTNNEKLMITKNNAREKSAFRRIPLLGLPADYEGDKKPNQSPTKEVGLIRKGRAMKLKREKRQLRRVVAF